MPMHWHIDHQEKMVYATISGELASQDFIAYLDAMFRENAISYPKLVDMLAYKLNWWTEQEILSVAAQAAAYRDSAVDRGPFAVLAKQPAVIKIIRRLVNLTNDDRRPVKIFRQVSKARAWLETQKPATSDSSTPVTDQVL